MAVRNSEEFLMRQKIPVAKSKKICGKYHVACYRDSKFLGIFFIKEMLFNQQPIFVGIQYNGLWAAFYKHDKGIFRIILDIKSDKIYIVTFYIINETQIPRI